ncbi:MAG: acyl-CoA dehydratase activase [Spirochaetia bacterium]
MRRLGIDAGSVSIGTVLLENQNIISSSYEEHGGDIRSRLKDVLESDLARDCHTIGITGRAAGQPGLFLDSTLCVIEGGHFLVPASRNIFSLGAEHFMLCFYDRHGSYREHTTNPPCASGTGSFIEQQAARLGISVRELEKKALEYTGEAPNIATRCAVFAKSDIIHAMQEGYSLEAVCAGLCRGISRTIADSLLKGRQLSEPAAMVGGVSLNRKIVTELEQILGIKVLAPRYSMVCGAVGAALLGDKAPKDFRHLFTADKTEKQVREPLTLALSDYPDFSSIRRELQNGVEIVSGHGGTAHPGPRPGGRMGTRTRPGGVTNTFARPDDLGSRRPGDQGTDNGLYLGLDIGSTSTKAVLINKQKQIIKGFYTRTGGKPIEAVQLLVRTIIKTMGEEEWFLAGAATTGSGRKMIKELFRADIEINEISAHAMAAAALYPEVDTIIEIGGQDSKFTLLKGGRVYFSHMNYVCAAGTGSFIEEQARLLDLELDDFSAAAGKGMAPFTSDRCTVYMERDLAELKGLGFSRESLAAAVLYSVRDNYLAKVVNKSPIGEHVVFQGATGRNKALVAAFEQILQKPVHVSPYCHLTGALGAALRCAEKNMQKSGFITEQNDFQIQEQTCSLCSNTCLLQVVHAGQRVSAWGMKCGREYADTRRKPAGKNHGPVQRFRAVFSPAASGQADTAAEAPVITLLDALYNLEYNCLWHDFFHKLGFRVHTIVSGPRSTALGRKLVNSDFCAPIIIAHGLLQQAVDQGARHIFLPALVREQETAAGEAVTFRQKTGDSYFCYYSQYLPTILSSLTSLDAQNTLISPLLSLAPDNGAQTAEVLWGELSGRFPRLTPQQVEQAFRGAYSAFLKKRRTLAAAAARRPHGPNVLSAAAGDKTPETETPQVILLGRPYVLFDQAVNLSIPEKIGALGAAVYSMYEIDLPPEPQAYAIKYFTHMPWNYGTRILCAAEFAACRENTFVVFLSCFRCSPDAFLLSYVKDIMSHYGKPFLLMQLDEHSQATGYSTRIEAAMEAFKNHMETASVVNAAPDGCEDEPMDDRGAEKPDNRKTGQAGAILDHAARAASGRTAWAATTNTPQTAFQPGDTVLIPYINNLISGFWADCFENAGFTARVLRSAKQDLLTGYRYANGGECMPAVAIVGGVIETVKREHLDPGHTGLYIPTVCMACNFPQFPVLADMAFREAGLHGIKTARINSMRQGDFLPGNLSMKIFEAGVLGSLVYKLYFRVSPYEAVSGSAGQALDRARELLHRCFRQGEDARAAFKQVCELFQSVPRSERAGRKARVGILGDFYVKYNEVVNQDLQRLIAELDAELVIPSFSELTFHFFDADSGIDPQSGRRMKILRMFEQRYEKMAGELLADQAEPDWHECVTLMREYGLKHYLPGETSITCGRALHGIKHRSFDAIVHVNPMFCCPGVVSASIFKKISRESGIPVVDLFYDGTGRPNRMIIPHLHYLQYKKGR